MSLPPELASLPPPEVIEEISYEARLTTFMVKLVALFQEYGVDYDVGTLETDPGKILMEVATYVDTNLRQRINEAVRANLLPYAVGADLDHLAAFYDVTRLYQETDDALRSRVVLAIRGRSPGGTEPRYRYVARSADVRVADANVYTVGRDPTVQVAIFSTDGDGVADQALINKVNLALQDPAVRMVNDVIVVAGAIRQATAIVANLWLLPAASEGLPNVIEQALRAAWAAEGGLGRDLTRSWLTKYLMQAGVHRVEILSPAADVEIPPNQAASIGTITLNVMGRAI